MQLIVIKEHNDKALGVLYNLQLAIVINKTNDAQILMTLVLLVVW